MKRRETQLHQWNIADAMTLIRMAASVLLLFLPLGSYWFFLAYIIAGLTDALGMPQSSLSYHMKILCDSGIVASREEGKWTHYRISPDGSARAIGLLREITATREDTQGAEASSGKEAAACRP